MRSLDSSTRFVGVLAILAVLSSAAALSMPEPSDPEPSTFESNAMLVP